MSVFSSNGHTASPYTVQEDENTTGNTNIKYLTQTLHIVLFHCLEKVNRATQVVLVILQWFALRLSHMLESSKMNNGLNIGVRLEHMINSIEIKQRTLVMNNPYNSNIHKMQLALSRLRHLLIRLKATDSGAYPPFMNHTWNWTGYPGSSLRIHSR